MCVFAAAGDGACGVVLASHGIKHTLKEGAEGWHIVLGYEGGSDFGVVGTYEGDIAFGEAYLSICSTDWSTPSWGGEAWDHIYELLKVEVLFVDRS